MHGDIVLTPDQQTRYSDGGWDAVHVRDECFEEAYRRGLDGLVLVWDAIEQEILFDLKA